MQTPITTIRGGLADRRDDAAAALAHMADGGGEPTAKAIPLTALSRAFLSGGAAGVGYDLNAPLRPYQQSLWVYRCVSEIQRTCAGIPLRLMVASDGVQVETRSHRTDIWRTPKRRTLRPVAGRRGVCVGRAADGEAVTAGEAYDLLERPNSYQSWPQLIQSTVGYLLLRGSVAWVLADMTGSRPGEIQCIDGRRIEPKLSRRDDGLLELEGYEYTAPKSGKKIPLAPDEVVYWPLWTDGDNPLEGLAPSVPGRLAIATEYNASLFNASLLNNGAVPGLKVTFPQELTPEQRDVFRAALRQRNAGAANAGKDLILEGGASADDLGRSMHDLQFDAGKKTTRLELCCLFGVPPVVAGWVDAAGDSSAYTSNALQQYYQQTIMPMLDMFLPGVQSIVSRIDGRLVAWWDMEDQPVVQQMRMARVETAKNLHGMGVRLSDINNVLDLGLPDREEYDIGYLPVGLVPAGEASLASLLPAQPEGPSSESSDELDQDGNALPYGSRLSGTAGAVPVLNRNLPAGQAGPAGMRVDDTDSAWDRAATRIWRAWARSWEPLAKGVHNLLRTRYVTQERRLIKALTAEVKAAAGGKGDPPSPIVGRVLLEVSADRETWRQKCRAFIADANELGIRQALVEAGVAGEALDETLRRLTANPAIAQALQSESVKISTLIDDRSRSILRRSLTEGLDAGDGFRELADRVQSVMGNRRKAAMNVARNAIGQTLSKARHEAHLRVGGLTHKYWLYSRGPGERRPAHIAAEYRYRKTPIAMTEPFVINGVALQYPRDFSSGGVAECVNCQCLKIGTRGLVADPTGRPGAPGLAALSDLTIYTYADMLRDRIAIPDNEETGDE